MQDRDRPQFSTTLKRETIEQIDQISASMRWNKNVAIEVAIEKLHSQLFSSPTSPLTVSEAINITIPSIANPAR